MHHLSAAVLAAVLVMAPATCLAARAADPGPAALLASEASSGEAAQTSPKSPVDGYEEQLLPEEPQGTAPQIPAASEAPPQAPAGQEAPPEAPAGQQGSPDSGAQVPPPPGGQAAPSH